jgi:peptidoglycan/xylan/chitin deacetylase (PgdA/CDA1 family)
MRPLALAYHGVDEVAVRHDPHGLFVAPRRLRRHVAFLRARGYELVGFGALVERATAGAGDGLAALTFDDGFADNETVLAPLLRELGAIATVFVTTGWMGTEHPDVPGKRLMDADAVRRLHAAGVEIGGHTVTHPDLTTLGFEAARDELASARRELEALLDAPVTSAAYPFGRATEETIRACAAAGFHAACRTSGNGAPDNALDFPREDMDGPATLLGLRLKAAGRYEPLMRRRPARMLRRAGRMLRRP